MNKISSKISIEFEVLKRKQAKQGQVNHNMTVVEEVSVDSTNNINISYMINSNSNISTIRDVVGPQQQTPPPNGGWITSQCTAVLQPPLQMICDNAVTKDEEEEQEQEQERGKNVATKQQQRRLIVDLCDNVNSDAIQMSPCLV